MTTISYSESIDFTLLEQYFELLGSEGIRESLTTLQQLMPEYISELEDKAAQQDETGFRRQAHKIKGGCRSLGFARLGKLMEFLERDQWRWDDTLEAIAQWQLWLPEDLQSVQNWLYTKEK
ncbi:MAG: Hpt domain-containing protein [Idiomarina sp.]|nr:Hpt domain-containing protein [Idiomarina sp.]